MINKSNINDKIKWCENYIKEYNKKYCFSPFMELTGANDTPQNERKQKIYIECVAFLQELEKITTEHENIMKNYL